MLTTRLPSHLCGQYCSIICLLQAKIPCSRLCRCVGCKNFEESPDRQNLLHLADAAEVRVQQQAAAETKLAGQLVGPPVRPAPPVSGAERSVASSLFIASAQHYLLASSHKCGCVMASLSTVVVISVHFPTEHSLFHAHVPLTATEVLLSQDRMCGTVYRLL